MYAITRADIRPINSFELQIFTARKSEITKPANHFVVVKKIST